MLRFKLMVEEDSQEGGISISPGVVVDEVITKKGHIYKLKYLNTGCVGDVLLKDSCDVTEEALRKHLEENFKELLDEVAENAGDIDFSKKYMHSLKRGANALIVIDEVKSYNTELVEFEHLAKHRKDIIRTEEITGINHLNKHIDFVIKHFQDNMFGKQ